MIYYKTVFSKLHLANFPLEGQSSVGTLMSKKGETNKTVDSVYLQGERGGLFFFASQMGL